jgi:signal transduction histidine kinase
MTEGVPPHTWLRWLTVCGPAAYLVAMSMGILYYHPHPLPPVWPAFVVLLTLSAVGTLVFSSFVFSHVQRQKEEIVRRSHELADAQEAIAVIKERQRISRELHDSLAQTLGYLHMQLADLERRVGQGEQVRMDTQLAELRGVARGAYEEARQAIFGLRSMVSRSLGLIPTLTEYLHDWSRRTGIAVDLTAGADEALTLAPVIEVQLIGIIQEALANVRKHAGARRVVVSVESDTTFARVTIQDDGRGFDPDEAASASFGIATMRERADTVGGKLMLTSRPGRGALVEVELPVAPPGDRRP